MVDFNEVIKKAKVSADQFKAQVQKKLAESDKYLLEKFPQLKEIQKKNVSPSALVAGGALVCLLLLVLVFGVAPLSNLLGFVYPAIESFRSLKASDNKNNKQWLGYWLIYGFLINLEGFGLSEWIYFYHFAKIVALLFCMSPQYKGAEMVLAFIEKHVNGAKDETSKDKAQEKVKDTLAKAKSIVEEAKSVVEETADVTEAMKKAE